MTKIATVIRPLGMTRTDLSYRADMPGDAATGYGSRLKPADSALEQAATRRDSRREAEALPLVSALLRRGTCLPRAGRFGEGRRSLYVCPSERRHDRGRRAALLRAGCPDANDHLKRPQVGRRTRLVSSPSRPRSPENYLEHLGDGGGSFNMMRIYPDRSVGVVIMGNATSYDRQRMAMRRARR